MSVEARDERATEPAGKLGAASISQDAGFLLAKLHAFGSVLNNRGADALSVGRWDECCVHFEESRAARRRAGDVVGMAQCLQNLAEVRTEQGRFDEAESFVRDARRIWRASGYVMGVAAATNTLGRTLARAGRAEEGVKLLRDAQQQFIVLRHAPWLAETEARLAEALVFAGHPVQATEVLDELADRAADGGPPVVALAQRLRGTIAALRGDVTDARSILLDARERADKAGVEWESALVALELARLADATVEGAEQLQREAWVVLKRMGIDAAKVMPPTGTNDLA